MVCKTIILDFDGTIVESVGIKDQAFIELFKEYPEQQKEILDYHRSYNTTIRFEKFRFITETILKKNYTKQIEERLSRQFSDLVFQRIVNCPFVSGAEEFLTYFYQKVPMYLASINPEEEFGRILSARNLARYFKKAYPFPWKKTDAIDDILRRENIKKDETILIGDSPQDYEAAFTAGVFFIGRGNNETFQQAKVPTFSNLIEIKNYILGNATKR